LDGTNFGTAGTSGTSGAGTSGSSGTSGTGTSGTSGVDGTFYGSSGTAGSGGTSGTTPPGFTSGTSGTDGVSGTSGTSAPGITSGTSGTDGLTGTSGSSGTTPPGFTSGTSGTDGVSGTSGSSGTTPPNFTSGTSGTNGGLITSGTAENGILTWQNTPAQANVESGLLFDGTILSINNGLGTDGSIDARYGYVFAKKFVETFSDLGTGGNATLDLNTANNFRRQFNGSATITFSNPPGSAGLGFGFTLTTVNAGAYSITWPVNVDWPGGTAPVLTSSGTDVLTFFTFNAGTTYYGFVVGKNLN
jgi:hypothetical protein